MSQEKRYIEKEISWLSFNERVLQEVADKHNPLLERVHFLGLYSNNLDEFYKVRFADVKRRLFMSTDHYSVSTTQHLLKKIKNKVSKAEQKFNKLYNELLLELARNQVFLIHENQLTNEQKQWLSSYFNKHLRQFFTPILINDDVNLLDFLKDDFTYLAVDIRHNDKSQYALLEIPTDKLPRFIQLPTKTRFHRERSTIILLDNIARFCLNEIFSIFFDFDSLNAYAIKMTRDSEYDLVYEVESSLLEQMSFNLKQRLTAKPVRFVYQKDMPEELIEIFRNKLAISIHDSIIAGGRYHQFKDFIEFPNTGKLQLLNKPLPPLRHLGFDQVRNAFEAIRKKDILLYYPYHTFEHVVELLRQASFDPNVRSIKINIYRVAKDSRIINSMIHAAHNGKKVTVVVEIQARFDEEANIKWAKRLTRSGVHVVFSSPGLKIHAKLFIISRYEGKELIHYAHIGTGNFNEKTASSYADLSLLTTNPLLTREVNQVFRFIENPYRPVSFQHLLVSPQNSRRRLIQLIDREIDHARQKKEAAIILKLNNLVDRELIDKLYQASNNGVKINLIIRGMCSLIPNIPYLSENIKIISIIDRYLEHARIYFFLNNHHSSLYISSADWMTRNIDYRIEVGTPILDANIKQKIMDILDIQLKDNVKARIIDKELSNRYNNGANKIKIRSQIEIYNYIKRIETSQNYNKEKNTHGTGKLI